MPRIRNKMDNCDDEGSGGNRCTSAQRPHLSDNTETDLGFTWLNPLLLTQAVKPMPGVFGSRRKRLCSPDTTIRYIPHPVLSFCTFTAPQHSGKRGPCRPGSQRGSGLLRVRARKGAGPAWTKSREACIIIRVGYKPIPADRAAETGSGWGRAGARRSRGWARRAPARLV